MTLKTAFTQSLSVSTPLHWHRWVTWPVARWPRRYQTAAASAWSEVAAAIETGWSESWRLWSDPPHCPWGVGLLTWALDVETLLWTLEYGPDAILLSFGDPRPFADAVRQVGCQADHPSDGSRGGVHRARRRCRCHRGPGLRGRRPRWPTSDAALCAGRRRPCRADTGSGGGRHCRWPWLGRGPHARGGRSTGRHPVRGQSRSPCCSISYQGDS